MNKTRFATTTLIGLLTAFLFFSHTALAQVPNYVPTNGLVGYWPFNGNANDESGNGNNGVASFVTNTTNRFSQPNSAFMFNSTQNGNNSTLEITENLLNIGQNQYTISFWFNKNNFVVGVFQLFVKDLIEGFISSLG